MGKRGQTSLAVTHLDGFSDVHLDVSPSGEEPEDLMVAAESFATAFVPQEEWVGTREIRVCLADGGQVTGLVQDVQLLPVGPGIRVVAVPLGYLRDRTPSAREETWCISGLAAETEPDGSFILAGLTQGVAYKLEVISDKFVAHPMDPAARVVAGASDVVLTVCDVYGVLLEFTCADEQYLADHFSVPPAATSHRMHAQFRRLVSWNSSLGVKRGVLGNVPRNSFSVPVLFALTARGDYGERIVTYEATIPGFETIKERIEIYPLRMGPIPVHTVQLVPNADGFGAVELRLTGQSAELLRESTAIAWLYLQQTPGGQKFSYTLDLRGEASSIVVPEVPSGTYTWELSAGVGWSTFEGRVDGSPARVNLEAGGIAVIEVPVADIAYVEFECHDRNGPVVAELRLASGPYFTAGHASRVKHVACLGSRYRFGPLAPGYYEVRAESPVVLADEVRTFTLEAGQVHLEVFVFP